MFKEYLKPSKLSMHLDLEFPLKFHLNGTPKKKLEGITYFSHGEYTRVTSILYFRF